MQALENTTVKGRLIDGSGKAVEQDVGGWIFMPPSHWELIKKEVEKAQEKK